jgi:hypothetical protein
MTDHIQLSDLAFQRHILVQALILIDFLLTLTEKSKSKPFYQNAQKAMQYNFTLREEDVSACHFAPSSSPSPSPLSHALMLASEFMIIIFPADH